MDYQNKIGSQAFCSNTLRRTLDGNPPCFGCVERHAKCHSECGKYKEWERIHRINQEEFSKDKGLSLEPYARKKEAVEKYYRREGKWRD